VKLLLSQESLDATLADKNGTTALLDVVKWEYGKAMGMHRRSRAGDELNTRSTDVLNALIEWYRVHGVSIDASTDVEGRSALFCAVSSEGDQFIWVQLLLKAGANPRALPRPSSAFGSFGWGSPIEEAASRSNTHVLAVLLAASRGCSVDDVAPHLADAQRLVALHSQIGVATRFYSPLPNSSAIKKRAAKATRAEARSRYAARRAVSEEAAQ
jgi:hypothetical protein